jgi:hypothetical protein
VEVGRGGAIFFWDTKNLLQEEASRLATSWTDIGMCCPPVSLLKSTVYNHLREPSAKSNTKNVDSTDNDSDTISSRQDCEYSPPVSSICPVGMPTSASETLETVSMDKATSNDTSVANPSVFTPDRSNQAVSSCQETSATEMKATSIENVFTKQFARQTTSTHIIVFRVLATKILAWVPCLMFAKIVPAVS